MNIEDIALMAFEAAYKKQVFLTNEGTIVDYFGKSIGQNYWFEDREKTQRASPP